MISDANSNKTSTKSKTIAADPSGSRFELFCYKFKFDGGRSWIGDRGSEIVDRRSLYDFRWKRL